MPTNGSDSQLSERVRERIARVADHLADAHRYTGSESELTFEEERDSILAGFEHRWMRRGSGRIVIGLGRTHKGRFICENRRPVVVKFQPHIGIEDVPSPSDNEHELSVWQEAVERGDEALFATIFDAGDTARWIAMEEGTPIYPSYPEPGADVQDYLIDWENEYLSQFRERCRERGWVGHDTKHGNIGLTVDGDVVWLDYGSFVRYDPEPE